MLGYEPQNKGLVTVKLDLTADILLVRGKLAAEPCGNIADKVGIVDYLHPSEDYYAPNLQRPFAAVAGTAVVYAEGDL